MFTRTLGRAALAAASLALAGVGATNAHARDTNGLWIESIAEVQGQIAAHLVRKFGLSPGEISFRYEINQSAHFIFIQPLGDNTYAGMPAGIAAWITLDQGTLLGAGATLSVAIAGAVGGTPLNGTGQIRVTSFDGDGGSLESDMQMTPGGGPGGGVVDPGGGGGNGDWNDYHSIINLYHDPERPMGTASTTTTWYTHNDIIVGDYSYSPDYYQNMGSTWTWQWKCPRISVGSVFASTSTTGTLDSSSNIGHFTITFDVPECSADFNADGAVDFFDYDEFVLAFESGDPSADFNHDTAIDFFDYDGFVVAFETPC
ncbi:MAG: hypothetical protein AABZ53_10120 [Planctomycetota bacterium]